MVPYSNQNRFCHACTLLQEREMLKEMKRTRTRHYTYLQANEHLQGKRGSTLFSIILRLQLQVLALMPVNLQSYEVREWSVGHGTGVSCCTSSTVIESYTASWTPPEPSRWSLAKLLVQTQIHNKEIHIKGLTRHQSRGTGMVLLKVLLT